MASPNRRNVKRNIKRETGAPVDTGRRALALLRLVGLYLAFVAIFLVWQQGWRWVEAQRFFDLQSVDVIGAERVSDAEIVGYSQLEKGVSVFDIDVAATALQVQSHPWVKQARVSRRLPDTLVIEIVEHKPVGVVKLDKLYYVNPEGVPFKIAPPEAADNYIVIDGMTGDDFKVMEVGQRMVRQALDVIDFYNQHDMGGLAPLKAIAHRYNGLELSIGSLPTQLVLGVGNLPDALDRAAKLWRHLKDEGRQAQAIHLDNRKNPERVTAKLVPLAEATNTEARN